MSTSTQKNQINFETFLVQHFATFATGPGGVARLRELILQLAIYGKLDTYDTNDDPVKLNELDKRNYPYLKIFSLKKLPKGWIWSKLGNIAEVGQGGTPRTSNPEFWNGSIPWLRSGNVKFNRINQANETISELGLQNSAAKLCPIGTVLLAMTGQGVTRGRAAILDIEASANQSCAHIILNKKLMIPEFLFYFFKTEYWNIRTLDKGTGQPGINTKIIKAFDIPLPPLAEQHRIVEKVDRLMALCDQLEKQQQQERSTCLQLGTASFAGLQDAESPEDFERQWAQICDTFNPMLDCPENVVVLRQTILQLAVQGKLGTQDERDEPASVLLERIRTEKERLVKLRQIKKENNPKPMLGDPFTIPKAWVWEKLGFLALKITDGEHFRPNTVQNGVKFLSAKDIRDDYIDFSNPLYVDEETAKKCWERCNPELNDILIVSRGAGVGRCCIVKTNESFCLLGSVILIKNTSFINSKYFLYALKSVTINNLISSLSSNTAQQALYIRDLKNMSIPLPPLAEQHRIVEKVDQLMALCDQLEAQLKNRAGVQERFAKAVVGGIAT